MKFIGKAEEAANDILNLFQNPNDLPEPLAQVFIHRKDNVPCRSWSWRNQLLAAIHGHADARGLKQWNQVGRHVKKGERAFYILSPLAYKRQDKETGEEKSGLCGFKGTPVFGYQQTLGAPLPVGDPEVEQWLEFSSPTRCCRKLGHLGGGVQRSIGRLPRPVSARRAGRSGHRGRCEEPFDLDP